MRLSHHIKIDLTGLKDSWSHFHRQQT